MGPENGRKVLEGAKRLAGGRQLILTLTHFHPEHGFGAQAFKGEATILYNAAQRDELAAKGAAYLGMFRGFGPGVAAALEGTELVMPDEVYDGASLTIDLGGRTVELSTYGLAHTKGDQVVSVPDAGVVFVGDLAEERIFPIFPWFPPDDADIDADNWARVLAALEAAKPEDRRPRPWFGRRRGDPFRRARLHCRPRPARRRRGERRQERRRNRRHAWPEGARRASRLGCARMDRFRHTLFCRQGLSSARMRTL